MYARTYRACLDHPLKVETRVRAAPCRSPWKVIPPNPCVAANLRQPVENDAGSHTYLNAERADLPDLRVGDCQGLRAAQVNVVASAIFLVAIAIALGNVLWQYRSARPKQTTWLENLLAQCGGLPTRCLSRTCLRRRRRRTCPTHRLVDAVTRRRPVVHERWDYEHWTARVQCALMADRAQE